MDIDITELEYVDPRQNSAKFYRVYKFGAVVTCQYGRIGTFGTFTPRKATSSEARAFTERDKKVAEKVAKGYNITKQGVVKFVGTANSAAPTNSDLDILVGGVGAPAGTISTGPIKAQSAVVEELRKVASIDPFVMDDVVEALEKVHGTPKPISVPTHPTRPMLAKEEGDPNAVKKLLGANRWWAQLKLDGDRVVVEVVSGTVSVLNRQGQPKVKNVSSAMLAPFNNLTEGRWVFDGEVVGRTLWLFDMLAAGDFHDESAPFMVRYDNLQTVLDVLNPPEEHVQLLGVAKTSDEKNALHLSALEDGKEGIILRDCKGEYEPGKRSTLLIKHKFLNEADCIVSEVGVGGKESVSLVVYDKDGKTVQVGSASTIGKTPTPKVGDVWEVRFLYVVEPNHPKMVQPRLMRIRKDKTADECFIEQFASAVTDKEVKV